MAWIGVDFDRTLATGITKQWDGPLGEPIAPMVSRVRGWLAQGIEVRIFTARVSPFLKDGTQPSPESMNALRNRIGEWCEEHLGQRLECTCTKDHNILQLWDDKAIQVVRDIGEPAGIRPRPKKQKVLIRCERCGTFLQEEICLLCTYGWKKDNNGLERGK